MVLWLVHMTKVVAPCFSIKAVGTLGKSISYVGKGGIDIVGYYKRRKKARPRTFSTRQKARQALFKNAIKSYKQFKPSSQHWWIYVAQRKPRMGRCAFMTAALGLGALWWDGYPYPPNSKKDNVLSKVQNYAQIVADVQTLTGVAFITTPIPLGVWNTVKPFLGTSEDPGTWIFFDWRVVKVVDVWTDVSAVAEALTQALLFQHDYQYYKHPDEHSIMSWQCGGLVSAGQLVPEYTYQGHNLQWWIDHG